jgi:hypothetical protein
LGVDLSPIRLHLGPEASASARALGALAYTHGHHIVVRQDHYAPATDGGRRLLAHELGHVLSPPRQALVGRQADPQADRHYEFEPEALTATVDRVEDHPPPFQGALAIQLPGNHYVTVDSHRYAVTDDPERAYKWARVLFGTRSAVIVMHATRSGSVQYMAAALSEDLSSGDLRVQELSGPSAPAGVTGAFGGRILATFPGDYQVAAVVFRDGISAPDVGTFGAFRALRLESIRAGTGGLDPTYARHLVFDPIDRILAGSDDDRIQQAAELLSELNSEAFAVLDWHTRQQYIQVLIQAWTWQRQEKAIVEILKSVPDRAELNAIFEQLRTAGLWEQLFNDMDDELWSMLVVLGQRFGDPSPLTFMGFVAILQATGIDPVTTGVSVVSGAPMFSPHLLAETEEMVRGFIRFVAGFLESIWMMISHPERVIDGVGQLMKMMLMAELARWGYPPAQAFMGNLLSSIGGQVLNGLKGVAVTGMGDAILRRVRWALIWEIASLFIGVGEIRAALEAVGVTERLAAVARFLGLIGEVAEEEQVVSRLQRLSGLLARTSHTLQTDEEVISLLSRLPEEDAGRLGRLLESSDLEGVTDLARLRELHPELAEAAEDSLRRAEALKALASKSGGQVTDDIARTFARLSRGEGRTTAELSQIIDAVPSGEGARFGRAIERMPTSALDGAKGASTLRLIAGSPARMDAVAEMGFGAFGTMMERAGGDGALLDDYLTALRQVESGFPEATRATQFRSFLDRLASGDVSAVQELEDGIRSGGGAPAQRLDAAQQAARQTSTAAGTTAGSTTTTPSTTGSTTTPSTTGSTTTPSTTGSTTTPTVTEPTTTTPSTTGSTTTPSTTGSTTTPTVTEPTTTTPSTTGSTTTPSTTGSTTTPTVTEPTTTTPSTTGSTTDPATGAGATATEVDPAAARQALAQRFTDVNQQIASLDSRISRLNERIDGIEKRINQLLDQRAPARGAERQRLEQQILDRQRTRDGLVRERSELGRQRGTLAEEGNLLGLRLNPSSRMALPCFPAGTAVATPAGSTAIELLGIGDEILSYDPDTDREMVVVVDHVFPNRADHVYRIELVDGASIRATGAHPFWEVGRRDWVAARSLGVGDHLFGLGGRPREILDVTFEPGEERSTYNLSVGPAHTYFVGPGVLVHNAAMTLPLGGRFVIYRGFIPGTRNDPTAPVYVGQTDQGVLVRQGQHRAEALRELQRTNLTAQERQFWEFKRDMVLEEFIDGVDSPYASYLEQRNIDIERQLRGRSNVMNRINAVDPERMPELTRQIAADPRVRAAGLCPP